MEASLWEHQREIAAVARHRSVLVSSTQSVGKTFMSCALLCDAAAAIPQQHALAVAASPAARSAIQTQLARLCGLRVLSSDDKTTSSSNCNQWLEDPLFARKQLQGSRGHITILSPLILQEALRKGALELQDVQLLVVEDWDLVHTELPSFFKLLTGLLDEIPAAKTLRIFATSRLPASKMDWDPVTNPLLKHLHVFNMLPVLSTTSMEPSFPPLHCEVFQKTERRMEEFSVRDFLLGANSKKVDLVHVFRLELELGNSAAVYDERKKQDKVNRFIQDAEAVEKHLGRWCLWKFVELELQTNLQACIVDDLDNVNNRKKRKQQGDAPETDDPMNGESIDSESENEPEDGEVDADEDDGEMMDVTSAEDNLEKQSETAQETKANRLIARFIGSSVELNASTRTKILPIVKVLSWLSVQSKLCGTQAASPRLLKTSDVVRNRFSNSPGKKTIRAWVFLERRCHCRVVAEYLTATLADLDLPPSCCMLGSSNARLSGALRFSSFLKVMQMFTNFKTKVMVTTSVSKSSQRMRMTPPPCDLVVVMDELLESHKLYEFGKRADAIKGVIKYITEDTVVARKKFDGLVRKMQEYVRLEQENNRLHPAAPQFALSSTSGNSDLRMPLPPPSSTNATLSSTRSTLATLQAETRISVIPKRVQPVVNPYEIINRDTGAILNVSNSVSRLSKFCDTLPGLDTYDRRPQYIVKRISIAKHMAPSLKRAKKKLLKYNAKLTDKIDVLKAEAEQRANEADGDIGGESSEVNGQSAAAVISTSAEDMRFNYSATLKLPGALGIRKQLHSQQVETQDEAKGIVAFKACQELVKKGLLDRDFRSKLLDDLVSTIHTDENGARSNSANGEKIGTDDTIVIGENDTAPETRLQLADLSTQSSYDLPPVSAEELSLRPIRSLTQEAASSREEGEEWSTTMCFYGLSGAHYAILATNELYTGNTNTGWRYDFATSGVMTPEIQPITLAKRPLEVSLTKQELHDVLHFHLIVMRLTCMGVQDAVRDVDIASDSVWNEFSEQNDKGYLVVPSLLDETKQPPTLSLDWEYIREIIGKPLLEPLWPLPTTGPTGNDADTIDEWICVPTFRLNVSYVVHSFSEKKVDDLRKEYLADEQTWTTHLKKGKSTPGNPILGRWNSRQQLEEADGEQQLIYGIQVPPIVPIIRRVMQRNHDEGSIAQSKTKFNERLLMPQYTSRLRFTKSRFFEAMGLIPLLYEFERKCQISHLMGKIGLELDMSLLDDATTKPAYERLEILGDTFLKLETSWYMYEQRKDISQEGQLTQLRRDIIRNDRLNQFALAARLHRYILYPAEVEQHPFQCWKPSCMGKTPDPVVAPAKWIADVLEAITGAYLVGQGEKGARYFLKWIGVSVLEHPSTNFARPFYPDCFPIELYEAEMTSRGGVQHPLSINFKVPQFEDLPKRLILLQKRLKYTFRNKRLLLEAVTHPSVGQLVLHIDQLDANGANEDAGGDIEVVSRTQKKKKTVWKGDYERLEYLGDALIEYLTLSYAFLKYDQWLPGSLSQWKSATVSNDALGKTALACFGIDECIFAGAVRIDRETMEHVAGIDRKYARTEASTGLSPAFEAVEVSKKQKGKSKGTSAGAVNHTLPKMFADVFEALVAAVFLDSGRDLQIIRDVFMGPLLETVGQDAYAYVCHESGLTMDNGGDDLMEDLMFSSDEED